MKNIKLKQNTEKLMIKTHYSLCSLEDVSSFIGLGVRTLKERWITNPKKVKQYNAIQVLSFLDKEGIDEQTLFKIVKNYNLVINDPEVREYIVNDVVKKGMNNA